MSTNVRYPRNIDDLVETGAAAAAAIDDDDGLGREGEEVVDDVLADARGHADAATSTSSRCKDEMVRHKLDTSTFHSKVKRGLNPHILAAACQVCKTGRQREGPGEAPVSATSHSIIGGGERQGYLLMRVPTKLREPETRACGCPVTQPSAGGDFGKYDGLLRALLVGAE
ncbi:hypothetical protein FIBSPDRAFT_901146 [Athelia psychrophila]|uniref:Uncharacterized protein n=1 Tax=Athelia psychrophila TaxID=1759441 RepID=A0A165XIG6_9AGAM|nr:hypothetical protein FIBSPDRAFT_901146 [Fibularhizoctonia sp. CBS 109695]